MKQTFKIILSIIILIQCFACNRKLIQASRSMTYPMIVSGEPFLWDSAGKYVTAMTQIYDSAKKTKERGLVVLYRDWSKTSLRTGRWKIFSFSNTLLAEGDFSVGTYIQCCFSGPCAQSYNYKSGNWQYFYPGGQPKAAGTYSIDSMTIHTSCGPEKIAKHCILTEWKCRKEDGTPIALTDSLKKEIEDFNLTEWTLARK